MPRRASGRGCRRPWSPLCFLTSCSVGRPNASRDRRIRSVDRIGRIRNKEHEHDPTYRGPSSTERRLPRVPRQLRLRDRLPRRARSSPRASTTATRGPSAGAWLSTSRCSSLFAVQHSVMARPWFKRWWTRIVPAVGRAQHVRARGERRRRACCCWQWRPLPDEVWSVGRLGPRAAVDAVRGAAGRSSWRARSSSATSTCSACARSSRGRGARQYAEPGFQQPRLYRFLRHPIMVGFLIAFWAAPDMSVGRLLFAGVATGVHRGRGPVRGARPARAAGRAYVRYAEQVPRFVPTSGRGWRPPHRPAHTEPRSDGVMRARTPDADGFVEQQRRQDPLRGARRRRSHVLLLPTWTIVHKRFWKAQVPYLARHHRVVSYDGPGNGRSDRPLDPAAYDHDRQVQYAVDVLDATGTDRAVVVGLSMGGCWALELAAEHADRVLGTVLIGASVPITDGHPTRVADGTAAGLATGVAGADWSGATRSSTGPSTTRTTGRTTTRTSSGSSSAMCFPEPHSTKQIEDAVALGSRDHRGRARRRAARRVARAGRRPRSGAGRSPARCWPSTATATGSAPLARAASGSPSSPAASAWSSRAAATSRSPATRSR